MGLPTLAATRQPHWSNCNRGSFYASVCVLFAALGLAEASIAAQITFFFVGTVSSDPQPSGIWAGQGSTVTGFYSYDTRLVDSTPTENNVDVFSADFAGNEQFSFEVSVTLGEVTRTTGSNENVPGTLHHRLTVFDTQGSNQFWLLSGRVQQLDDMGWI